MASLHALATRAIFGDHCSIYIGLPCMLSPTSPLSPVTFDFSLHSRSLPCSFFLAIHMRTKRSRDWYAYYSDSEDEGQAWINASVDEKGAISYSRSPAVTQKPEARCVRRATTVGEAEPAESCPSEPPEAPVEKRRNKQTTAVMAEVLLEHSDALRDAILSREHEDGIGDPCICNTDSALAIYRCIECLSRPPLCRSCIVTAHGHMPLHWIEKWDGNQFVKECLANIGLDITLGHHSRRCKRAVYGPESGRLITIVHTNGIHRIRIVACACSNPRIPDGIQFARAGFFPATMEQPRTVFTFQVLKNFEAHRVEAGKSVQMYCAELQRLTSNASPTTIPSRYPSFLPVVQVWRKLTSSRDQDIDRGLESDPPASSKTPSEVESRLLEGNTCT